MDNLSIETSQEFIKLCANFFRENKLNITQAEILIQQLEFEWHNTLLIKRLLENPNKIKELLKEIEEI